MANRHALTSAVAIGLVAWTAIAAQLAAATAELERLPVVVGEPASALPSDPPAVMPAPATAPPLEPVPASPAPANMTPAAPTAPPPDGSDPAFLRPPGDPAPGLPEGPAAVVLKEDPPPPLKLWEGSLAMGLDGSEGNTNTFNFRTTGGFKRKSPWSALSFQADYNKKSTNEDETMNRLLAESRAERFFLGSPWTLFVHGTFQYDDFAAYDSRVTGDVGVGHKLLDSPTTTLTARLGMGVAREIGGPDDRYVPEAVMGADFQHKLGKTHKLTASVEYMPNVTDFAEYRINSQAGWELLLDERLNLSMKLGIFDRYDSTPNGREPNDMDYAALLLWKF